MTHAFSNGKGRSVYRYYRCVHALKNGSDSCTSGHLPAQEIERVVANEIRGLSKDDTLLDQVLADADAAIGGDLANARRERDEVRRRIARQHKELQQLVATGKVTADMTGRVADLHARLAMDEQTPPRTGCPYYDVGEADRHAGRSQGRVG